MSKFRILNIALVILIVCGYFFEFSIWYYVIIILLSSIIIGYAVSTIGFNFFIHAFNSNTSTNEKSICLTFDDGPDPAQTPGILNILNEFGCKATFFVIGKNIAGNEDILQQMDREVHLIGNHTFNHSFMFTIKGKAWAKVEIEETSKAIYKAIGKSPVVFRPPFGVTNPNIARAVNSLGMKVLGWNIRSFDTKKQGVNVILKRVIRQCRPGSVVLFHDGIPETAMVLRQFLVFLKQNEYKVILPDEMFGIQWYKDETP